MDILYISPQTGHDLTNYCESDLIIEVMEHFIMNGKLIAQTNGEHPNRWWVITEYIDNQTINSRKKLSVILSFAAIGGFVQIGERKEVGDMNVLNMLKELFYIDEIDYDYFIEAFYNFSHGCGAKFS